MVDLIQITPAQMRMFEAGAEEAFQRRLAQQVRDDAAPSLEDLDQPGLARVVRAGVARARGYGLTWQSTLAGFVDVMTDVSPDWDGQPELHAALLRRRAAANESFIGLFRDTTDEAWEQAAAMRSGVGWFLPVALPWTHPRERVAAALPAALEAVRPIDPGTALGLADAGQQLAFESKRDSEDATFLLAVGYAVAGETKVRRLLSVMNSGPTVGNPAWLNVLRSWVRHNTGLWV